MATRDKAVEQVSPLPEKFEAFERKIQQDRDDYHARLSNHLGDVAKAGRAPKRRRSTPAVKPKDMPESATKSTEKAERPTMVESSWNGRQMWRCPECGDTTFKPQVVNIHRCVKPREAKV